MFTLTREHGAAFGLRKLENFMSNLNRIFHILRNKRSHAALSRRQVKAVAVEVARKYPDFHRF